MYEKPGYLVIIHITSILMDDLRYVILNDDINPVVFDYYHYIIHVHNTNLLIQISFFLSHPIVSMFLRK